MKKVAIFSIFLLLALFGAGFFVIKNYLQTKDEILDFQLSTNVLELEIGEKIDLDNIYFINATTENYVVSFSLSRYDCAKINAHNVLTAENVGEEEMTIVASTKDDRVERKISVKISEETTIPTSFSFEKSEIELFINESVTNKIVCDEIFNAAAEIEYSTQNICEYDAKNGQIVAKNVGETRVCATFSSRGASISQSFVVKIKEKTGEDNEQIVLDLEKENGVYKLNIALDETKVVEILEPTNQKFLINEDNSTNLLKISQSENNKIILKAISKGTTTLKITLASSQTTSSAISTSSETSTASETSITVIVIVS